ncbi:hypothetical protein QUA81_21055 [Microcoleus sp. F6_B4]
MKTGSKSAPSRQNTKQSPKQEEDDIDQLLSDDEDTPITTGVLGKIAKNRNPQKSINNAETQQSETKSPLLDSLETFLKQTEHQGAIAILIRSLASLIQVLTPLMLRQRSGSSKR